MLEIEATPFLAAVTELRTLIVRIDNIQNASHQVASDERTGILGQHVRRLVSEMTKLGARSALASVNRLDHRLADSADGITYADVRAVLADIESRFADHLSDIRLFVLNQNEAGLLEPADNLLATDNKPITGFSLAYPRSAFEIEESAKCIALARYTASAFHAIRALECGIKAIASYLEIPDPTEPAEKNWGFILGKIKGRIDEKWPKKARAHDSIGARFEALYATLDAVKNPWRNATMHVETTYAPHEAVHILRCVGMFMTALSGYCDEEGRSPDTAPAMTVIEADASQEPPVQTTVQNPNA